MNEGSLTEGESSLDTTPPPPPLIAVKDLVAYVQKVFTCFDDDAPTEQLQRNLNDAADLLFRFIGDLQVKSLFVQKVISNQEDESGGSPRSLPPASVPMCTYLVSNEVSFSSIHSTGLLFTKRGGQLEGEKSLPSQLRTVVLNEGSPYETLHSYISSAVSPFFKSFLYSNEVTANEPTPTDNKLGPSIAKKLTELELGLLHLQQNIDIPEISLVIHPLVAQVISNCAKENRKPRVEDFGEKVEDSSFLNSLQQGVNRWIKEIQKVSKLERDPTSGTTLQEINFWVNLERSLLKLQEKRESLEIELTLDILRHGKRFHATVSFDTDTGLKGALATVTDYNQLMKDFPINDLLSASDLDKIRSSVQAIFIHLRKIRNTKYPINRALRLIEAISKDLLAQLLKVLATKRLMGVQYGDFEQVMNSCFEILNTWDEEYEKLQALFRDIMKKKRSSDEIKLMWRISPAHKKLAQRVEQIRKFRFQHEQLRTVIERVLRSGDYQQRAFHQDSYTSSPNEEVRLAYGLLEHMDILDVSKEGCELWDEVLKAYNEKINSVEAKITGELREQLATAKSANEMFRIFARFNALFVRPQIRGAIREYQTQLISRVKDDIEKLHEKFKVQYALSKACRMSELRDIPPVAGSIIWAKQIDSQLLTYLKRVESILGVGWENHVDGQRLKADGDSFRQKLNTQGIFEEWVSRVQQRDTSVTGRIFDIEITRTKNPATGKHILKLKVNFLPEVITLSKEVRHLKNLGFRVPLAIMNKAHQANQMYPFAISLIESIRTYERSLEKVDENSNVNLLLAGSRQEIHTLISEGIGLVWESYKLDTYVKKLSENVFQFAEKVDEVLYILEEISVEIKSLESCVYSNKTVSEILGRIQKAVDSLCLKNYTNLGRWILWIDSEVEERLSRRLEQGILSWVKKLDGHREEEEEDGQPRKNLGGEPELGELKLELRMTQQTLWVFPPVEEIRQQLLTKLFSWQAIITLQPRIQSSRYQVSLDRSVEGLWYKDLLSRLPGGGRVLESAYEAIERKYSSVNNYVNEWLCYQSLWDLQPDVLFSRLQTDLRLWINCLNDIKETRSTFDTTEVRKTFGPIAIEYGKVQSKVSLKYDAWHKDVLSKFSHLLGAQMNTFYGEIGKARYDLEQQSIETSTTSEAVALITYVQNLKKKILSWEDEVVLYKDGQRLLERQRFQLPYNWLHIDTIEGEWSSFLEILSRKDVSIQTQVATLQSKILNEDKLVESRMELFLVDWEREKPIRQDMKPFDALAHLHHFETRFQKLNEERVNILKAKEALEIQSHQNLNSPFQVAAEELLDLKSVWLELGKISEQVDVLREKLWLSVIPRKIRAELDNLIGQLKGLPGKLKQYASYDYIKRTLVDYTKVNSLLIELKSESIKERHWKSLIKALSLPPLYLSTHDLTLGHIWEIDLTRNRNVLNEVITVAQGEMALEIFLKQVREYWNGYELELVNYQNKTKLIKSWEELFTKLKEHLNSVMAMKLSPYYRIFEEETLLWEEKLNRTNNLFDTWIDVQRRWVYLEGIFLSSEDIKLLLPNESNRFSSISVEFLSLMKRVAKAPKPLDIINIPGIGRSLERLSDLLTKIQKALGEYLERERNSFPRFYFIGDEDLLEIIGNSKNLFKLQKHYKKMFSGIHALIINETEVLGISSKEGEEIRFTNPFNISSLKINEWLNRVESEMRSELARLLSESLTDIVFGKPEVSYGALLDWIDAFPIQLIPIASAIWWTRTTEAEFHDLRPLLGKIEKILEVLAHSILVEQPLLRRKKYEHLITEFVHKRGLTRDLIQSGVRDKSQFLWLKQMRFYYQDAERDPLQRLRIVIANAEFNYGFEYLGVIEKLVQTPLTDKCYLAMTHALEYKLGGSPFGPAGTGKTESVKSLGHSLGRFVLVFNCDETFDFQAMGRIFIGLCQVGAWGCFDEFNRLEERMLSAVSQQIQTIQEALKSGNLEIDLLGKPLRISPQMATFITMNPGYTGRSNLPDNLKQLFRSLAMTTPDRQLIAEVMLFSQGFKTSETLAAKIVPFFQLCEQELTKQSHYDFGLRALKSVLISSGNLKREYIQNLKQDALSRGETVNELEISQNLSEEEILIQSICETIVPKLVAEDIAVLFSLLRRVFPNSRYVPSPLVRLKDIIRTLCRENYLLAGANNQAINLWMEKVLQLYQIQSIHHGVMLVGSSGTGKTAAWKILLKSLEKLEGVESNYYIINPKSISKENLYGFMDPNTREWSDGLFTHILRKIIDNLRGERSKRQWIVFDGDVDPEWVENLNSVLDDNKLLTLPNGERLALPSNVRLIFEVQDLKYATLATVSRCGMVWFSTDVVNRSMLYYNYLSRLKDLSLDESEGGNDSGYFSVVPKREGESDVSPTLLLQRTVAGILEPFFGPNNLVEKALEFAAGLVHIMDHTSIRSISTLFSMLNESIRKLLHYNQSHSDFPLDQEAVITYTRRSLLYSLLWSFTGDTKLKIRSKFSEFLRTLTTFELPQGDLVDYEMGFTGWSPWLSKVPKLDIDTSKVGSTDCVIPTVDTIRHERLLRTWLNEHKPLVLCGPPGSGKTMTLLSALRALPDMDVISLNFSSATTPELLLKTFDHYCEYRKTPNGIFLSPLQIGKWLILFCDEINLPEFDKYGTQRVISFLRQLVEYGTFYNSDHQLIRLERIQFVGACNPPTDPGRKPLSHRFLRHVPIIYVDYPGETSLKQIYGTFCHAMLKLHPQLLTYANALTSSMVEFYLRSQERFTQDMQPHYIYSPRELTRWVRGIYEAIKPLDELDLGGLVRLWAHEGLRLFQDRLVLEEERKWTNDFLDSIALTYFPSIRSGTLQRPILYSNWLSKNYVSVSPLELRDYIKARLQIFYQEELDIPLVLFDDLLEHILRIDRIFKQTQGHLLLIGMAGSGKTTISRFVAWINGLKVYQIKVHNKYSSEDFDNDLKTILKLTGVKNEKICFILDESNVLDSSFLERMNTLLANGEVPGVFEGDEYNSLMVQIKEASTKAGLMLDTNEELYKYFCTQIIKNLHIIFTMNPKDEEDLKSRASTSPALFNRCVLDWYGNWSQYSLFQVGRELTLKYDLDKTNYTTNQMVFDRENPTYRDILVFTLVHIHNSLIKLNDKLTKRKVLKVPSITPRHFLDFIHHFTKLYNEKRANLEDEQLHLTRGLNKINETVEQIAELKAQLEIKSRELNTKNEMANMKLKEMMEKQQEAERRKVLNQTIQKDLEIQNHNISEKQKVVKKDLELVEPAVRDAESSVQSIKKQQLVEVRSMANPPAIVKLALESICLLLGESTTDWKQIRTILMRENFITTIVNFNTDDISDDIRSTMRNKYLSNPDYNFEKVNRASLACGPLVKWAIAQYHYSDILKKIEPLRIELRSLQELAETNQRNSLQVTQDIHELESVIVKYKEEYAGLISQASLIKNDLEVVEQRVTRSLQLIKKLSSESERWEESSKLFNRQMDTLVGDVVLSAAFLTYAGYYDQHYREYLWTNWRNFLEAHEILFKPELALCEYLSHPDERLRWKDNSLPDDDLCTENAIMLKRFNRFPLIIDPSGQAIEFLQKEYADKKLTLTSFLDDSFRKNLESALRFGNPLLVQDVENYDPLLNPVLNHEVKRSGGRVLITIGEQDIDLSPSFNIFLSTRDPSVEFSSDLASRVTFINFTTTRSSLQYQCLNSVLKSERPDIDEKRRDLLKLQGEFQVRLRQLEKSLLLALNETKGKLLDDDSILSTLENLKTESIEISSKFEQTEVVIREIESVSKEYLPLASHCSSIYFALEYLNHAHFLYQYSLQFFLEIFNTVLLSDGLKNTQDYGKRIDIITTSLFNVTYARVSRGMLHMDRLILALLLAKIRTKGRYDAFFDALIHSKQSISKDTHHESRLGGQLSKEESEAVRYLESRLPKVFGTISQNLSRNMDDFSSWLKSPTPEALIPSYLLPEKSGDDAVNTLFEKVLLIQVFRPDRLLTITNNLVEGIFGEEFTGNAELNLHQIVDKEINCNTPILLCSVPGYDPSGRIETLASQNNVQLSSIAIGSAEGFTLADASIKMGTKNGRWVLLKNVHLAPSWLLQLEKKLHSLTPHPNFRLFLTMDIHPKIPINLLRSGRIFVYEAPPGIKYNLLRVFNTLSPGRMGRLPVERSKLYFLLAWFHAIVQERLRYVPLGWTKTYDFNESDLLVSYDTIDEWIDSVAANRTNLPPDKIPWDALNTLLGNIIYGGKLDSDQDAELLQSLVSRLFNPKCFDSDFYLIFNNNEKNILIPEAIKYTEYVDWIHKINHSQQTPSWLGLPNSAEKVLLTQRGSEMISKLLKMEQMQEDDDYESSF